MIASHQQGHHKHVTLHTRLPIPWLLLILRVSQTIPFLQKIPSSFFPVTCTG